MKKALDSIITILLTAALFGMHFFFFLHYYAQLYELPSGGVIDGGQLTELFSSVLIFPLAAIVPLICVILLCIAEKDRFRNVFLYCGIAFLVNIIGNLAVIGTGTQSHEPFCEFLKLTLLGLIPAAIVCFSVFASASILKGGEE